MGTVEVLINSLVGPPKISCLRRECVNAPLIIKSAENLSAASINAWPTLHPLWSMVRAVDEIPLAFRCRQTSSPAGPDTEAPSTVTTSTSSMSVRIDIAPVSVLAVSVLPFQASNIFRPIVAGISSLTIKSGRPLSNITASAVVFQSTAESPMDRPRITKSNSLEYSPIPSGPDPTISVQPARKPEASRSPSGMSFASSSSKYLSRPASAC